MAMTMFVLAKQKTDLSSLFDHYIDLISFCFGITVRPLVCMQIFSSVVSILQTFFLVEKLENGINYNDHFI